MAVLCDSCGVGGANSGNKLRRTEPLMLTPPGKPLCFSCWVLANPGPVTCVTPNCQNPVVNLFGQTNCKCHQCCCNMAKPYSVFGDSMYRLTTFQLDGFVWHSIEKQGQPYVLATFDFSHLANLGMTPIVRISPALKLFLTKFQASLSDEWLATQLIATIKRLSEPSVVSNT